MGKEKGEGGARLWGAFGMWAIGDRRKFGLIDMVLSRSTGWERFR